MRSGTGRGLGSSPNLPRAPHEPHAPHRGRAPRSARTATGPLLRRDVHFALENDGWNCTFECKVHVSASGSAHRGPGPPGEEKRPRRPRRRTGGATRAARTSPDSRDRRATRENVCRGYVLAGCPAISRVRVRSRRLPGDLADPTGAGWDGAGTRAGPATIPACSRPIPGPARSASERGRAGGRRRRRDPGQKPRGNRHHVKEPASVGAFPVTRATESPSRQGLRPQPPVTGDRNGHRPRPASAVPGAFPPTDGARWRAAPP